MERDESIQPTPEQARAALAENDRAAAAARTLRHTPWPWWYTSYLAVYLAILPILVGGMTAEWLLPQFAWLIILLVLIAISSAMFTVAAKAWRERTGVHNIFQTPPMRVWFPLAALYAVAIIVGIALFAANDQIVFVLPASVVGAAFAVVMHLWFRKQSGTS